MGPTCTGEDAVMIWCDFDDNDDDNRSDFDDDDNWSDIDDDIKLVCTYLESNHFGSKILRACNPQLLIS